LKTLTLFRHAKSSWIYPLEDIFRPLNRRGFKPAQFMAQHCVLPPPDIIFCSPANRAYSKALFYLQVYELPLNTLHLCAELYQRSAHQQLSWLRTLPNKMDHVWLFGHNPDLSELATVLLEKNRYSDENSKPPELVTAAYIHLNLPIVPWSALQQGSGELVYTKEPNKKQVV
jgi:phosphohistidine phosphatase